MDKIRRVICTQCYQSTHELTDKYDPKVPVNGTMIRLSEPFRSYGWETHNEEDLGVGEGDILCGHCGNKLVIDNLVVTEDEYIGVQEEVEEEEDNKPKFKKKTKIKYRKGDKRNGAED